MWVVKFRHNDDAVANVKVDIRGSQAGPRLARQRPGHFVDPRRLLFRY